MKEDKTRKDRGGQQVAVEPDNSAIVTCPNCRVRYTVNAAAVTTRGRTSRLRCKCGHAFSIFFEFRETPRRQHVVKGYYRLFREFYVRGGTRTLRTSENFREMLVKDISRSGIGFKTATLHGLNIGERIEVMFTLDDLQETHIERKATVRRVAEGNYLGCEFTDLGYVDKDTGFFVMT